MRNSRSEPTPEPRPSSKVWGLARRRIVVVGGGVVGCAVAFQLSNEGFEVTLIERDAIAAHASGRSAGNLNPLHGAPTELIPFALEAFRIHAETRAALSQLGCANFVARPVKRLHLGFEEADRASLEETAALFAAFDGFSSVRLDRKDLRRLEPRLAPDIAFGVLTEGNLSVDSYEFTCSLADGAARLGAAILHETVTGVVTHDDRVTGVRTGQGVIACDEAVFATGPWVANVDAWLGIEVPVEPVKGEILRMRLPETAPRYDLTWGATSLYQRRENEIWVGATMSKVGFDCRPTAEAKASLLDCAARILPDIERAELIDHTAALRPVASANAPVACRAQGWRNVFVANGGGSKGVLLSVGIARTICDLVAEGHAKISSIV